MRGIFKWKAGEAERISLLPIRHDDIWWFRKRLEGLHWTAQAVDITRDQKDWSIMPEDSKRYIRMQLMFFAQADMLVFDNVGDKFIREVDCMEARAVYAAQQDQEMMHTECYNLQVEAVAGSEAERETIFRAIKELPAVAAMPLWALHWLDGRRSLEERLVAAAAVEGVLFSAGFASLQWLREQNLLPGITMFNTYISRDEGLHTLFSCLLVRVYLTDRPSQRRAAAIFASAIKVLDAFVGESLPVRLIGMVVEDMRAYTRFQADCILREMGYDILYSAKNPFPFMDKLSLNGSAKTNFFESRVDAYQQIIRAGASRLARDKTPIDE